MSLTDIHFRFEARSLQRLHKVPILSPILIWVRAGTKRMHTHSQPIECPADHCLILPPVEARHMENIPSIQGVYLAEVFARPEPGPSALCSVMARCYPLWQPEPQFACPALVQHALTNLLQCHGEGALAATAAS